MLMEHIVGQYEMSFVTGSTQWTDKLLDIMKHILEWIDSTQSTDICHQRHSQTS